MHHIEGIDRNQMSFIALEELVDQNSWARLVDIFVDSLPLSRLGFTKVDLKEEGRPPFHPTVLLKLYMYGYKHGIRSSRKLEHACKVNVELWWLLNGQIPSNRTIAAFRKENSKAFKNAFRHFVLMLKDWNLIDGETIAIDSFKIRAQNSLKNNFNQKKIDRHIEYIDNKIAEYEHQLDREENSEKKEELTTKIDYQRSKKKNYKSIEKELKQSGTTQISKIDPDAKAVVLHRNIVNVGYNIQAGCDAKHKLFINAQTGDVNDLYALYPMAKQAKDLLNPRTMKTLTDKGYTNGKILAQCKQEGILTYSSPKDHSSPNNGLFAMKIFKYDPEEDTYTCPANQILTTNGNIYNKRNHKVKHYKTKACKTCEIRSLCTANKNGRFIERGIHQEVLEENEKRVLENPDYYRLRQQITEHQFGTLKRQWGFTFTLMRGKENVLCEVNLLFTIYNLTRALTILGPKALKEHLKAQMLMSFSQIRTHISQFKSFYKCSSRIMNTLLVSSNRFTDSQNRFLKYI